MQHIFVFLHFCLPTTNISYTFCLFLRFIFNYFIVLVRADICIFLITAVFLDFSIARYMADNLKVILNYGLLGPGGTVGKLEIGVKIL